MSDQLAIPRGNMAAYSATPAGTQAAWDTHSRATRRRFTEQVNDSVSALDFYGDDIATIAEDAPRV